MVAASNDGQWTMAFVKASASIVAVVTNASVAPCAPQKNCLSIAVTIRSRLSDPFHLSDLTDGAKSPLALSSESVEESTKQRATFQLERTRATVLSRQPLTLSMPQLQEYSEPHV